MRGRELLRIWIAENVELYGMVCYTVNIIVNDKSMFMEESQMDKLTFLKKFRKDVEIIDTKKVGDISIPELWLTIFNEKDFSAKKDKIVDQWKQVVGSELPDSIAFIEENLYEMDLIHYRDKISILYGIRCEDGKIYYFEGGNPKECIEHKLLEGMPLKLKSFYLDLHNGFFFYPSRMRGLVPLNEVTCFADDEWGIIDELEEPLQISLDTTYGFYNSGGGGYLAIDYNNCENNIATRWYDDIDPDYNIDFWEYADKWIMNGFE